MFDESIEYSENNYNRPDLIFCEMCDDTHEDNTQCQRPIGD